MGILHTLFQNCSIYVTYLFIDHSSGLILNALNTQNIVYTLTNLASVPSFAHSTGSPNLSTTL